MFARRISSLPCGYVVVVGGAVKLCVFGVLGVEVDRSSARRSVSLSSTLLVYSHLSFHTQEVHQSVNRSVSDEQRTVYLAVLELRGAVL